jgi:hypothetical protein
VYAPRKPAAALLAAALLLTAAGCGSSGSNSEESRPSATIAATISATPTATPAPSGSPSASPSATMTPEPSDVPFTPGVEVLDDKVVVRMELADLRPTTMPQPVVKLNEGQGEQTFMLTADLTGSFLVELHDNDKELFSLQVS